MNLSAELQVAALVLDQALSSSISWKANIDVSPENVLRTLTENRVSLIYLSGSAKTASNWLATAPGFEEELNKQKRSLGRALNHYREVNALFKQQGFDSLLIKSVGFFPPETSNIDVLVRHQNLTKARECLLKLGYIHHKRYLRPDKFLFPRFLGAERDSLIHLHTRVSWGPPFLDEQRIWDRCRTTIEGDLQPAAEQAFMITLAHNFYEDSEYDLWDLAKLRLCKPSELDWNEIFPETKRWGWKNGMALSLLVLNQAHESLFNGQSLVPKEVSKELNSIITNLDGTRQYWEKWRKEHSLSLPIIFPKVFTKAHAYLTSIRSKPTSWRLKLRDMGLLTRWASETLFGIRARRSFLVAFCGPDGSGKTTLSDAVYKTIISTDEHPRRVWLRIGDSPFLKPFKERARPYVKMENHGEQHVGPMSVGLWRSLWLWFAVLDWGVRVLFLIQIPIWGRRIVICDRYILDAMVDLSYRVTWETVQKSKLVRLLLRLAPVPDVTFSCIAPADVLLQRRPDDLTAEKAEQIVEGYHKARNMIPNLIDIDTTQEEIQSITTVVHKVVEDYYSLYETHRS